MHRFGRIMEILYGTKNGVHAFGYNSTECEQIWMKYMGFYMENREHVVWAAHGRFWTRCAQ